jgi:hypothetical protein
MSYIGGSQFSVDNRTDNELFSCIDRADMMEKIKADIMPMGYTGRIQANSSANYARNYQGQLANTYGVNNRDPSLYQYSGFKDDKINASSRETQSASRFNYAYDRQVNKRYVDVSGQNIPNNHLRVIPNRSCMMNGAFPLTKPSSANKYLTFKANRSKLTRQDLTNSAQQYAMARPQVLANPLSNPIAPQAFDAMESARRRQQLRDETAQNIRETRGMRGGLTIDIPSI